VRKSGTLVFVALGFLALIQALTLFGYPASVIGAQGLSGSEMRSLWVVSFLPLISSISAGVLLIIGREWLADRLLPGESPEFAVDAASLLRIGLTVLGVWLFAQSISDVASVPMRLALQSAQERVLYENLGARSYVPYLLGTLATPILRLSVGALLVIFSKRLSERLWPRDSSEPEADTVEAAMPRCPNCGTQFDPEDYRDGLATPLCVECKEPLDLDRA
jgi:hypothetical protein